MRIEGKKPIALQGKRNDRPKGLVGLMLYGSLTILGGLALVVMAE